MLYRYSSSLFTNATLAVIFSKYFILKYCANVSGDLIMIFYHDICFHHHLPCRKPTFPVTNSFEQTPLYIYLISLKVDVTNKMISFKYHTVPSRNFSWYANRQYRLDTGGPTFASPSDIQLEDLVLQRSELE